MISSCWPRNVQICRLKMLECFLACRRKFSLKMRREFGCATPPRRKSNRDVMMPPIICNLRVTEFGIVACKFSGSCWV